MCGVSTQTVSRVINKRPDVSPETRAAVEAAIARVGFQPSALARSLVQRRSLTFGVITAGLRYLGVSQTLHGIAEASTAAGYGLLLKELGRFDTPNIAPVVDFLVAHRVEGIIFTAPEIGANVRTVQAQLPPGAPPVVFTRSLPAPGFTTISVDNLGGGRRATEHLVALGRRRIGHISGPVDWFEARERRDGWLGALEAAGLEPGPVVEGNWSSASGAAAFEQLIAVAGVDAVFAGNDQMALGMLHAAHARGIRVPDDIAVVGFDNLDESEHFTPSLTTMHQPLRELGQLAVRELLEHLGDEPAEPRHVVLGTDLIVRDSAPLVAATEATASGAAAR